MDGPKPDVKVANRDPTALCPCMLPLLNVLLREAAHSQISVTLIETIRTPERQEYLVSIGMSRTRNSKHLAHPPNGKSLAFDVCPTEYLREKLWNPRGIYWSRLAVIGRTAGLKWGGDWKFRDGWKDLTHFELLACACEVMP